MTHYLITIKLIDFKEVNFIFFNPKESGRNNSSEQIQAFLMKRFGHVSIDVAKMSFWEVLQLKKLSKFPYSYSTRNETTVLLRANNQLKTYMK